jgi:hypothetical protein
VGAPGSRSIKTNAGIVIAGDAQVNTGSLDLPCTPSFAPGSTNTGSSGTLQYVQVHFLSGSSTLDFMANALTLVGVGSGTTIDHVEITHSAGSGLGIIGGRPAVENLFVMNTARNDIYVSLGAQTSLEEVLTIHKDCDLHHEEGTNGLFVENSPIDPLDTPFTLVTIDRATFIGPLHCDCEPHADFQNGIHLDNNAGLDISNSVVTGYNGFGFYIEDIRSAENTDNGRVQVNYTSFTNNSAGDYGYNTSVISWSTEGCGSSMDSWIDGSAILCGQENNQFSPFNLDYNESICDDYCTTVPEFTLGMNTQIDFIEGSMSIRRGSIQPTDNFTHIDPCPQDKVYCEPAPLLKEAPQSLQVYPNPAQGNATIAFEADETGKTEVVIFEMVTGRVLYKKHVTLRHTGNQEIRISLPGWKDGIYPVQITTSNKVLHGKISIK